MTVAVGRQVAAEPPGRTPVARAPIRAPARRPASRAVRPALERIAGPGSGPRTPLFLGAAHDPLEHEAERVAREITDRTAPGTSARAAPGEPGGGRGSEPRPSVVTVLRSRAPAPSDPAPTASERAPAAVEDVLASPGTTLDSGTRAAFEAALGVDLGGVRVHTDHAAGASARAVGAQAYTVGSDVVFDHGAYAPHSDGGRHLLAHELVHVVQQDGGRLRRLQRAMVWSDGYANPYPSFAAEVASNKRKTWN